MNPREYAADLRSWAHVNEDEDSYEMSEHLRGAADYIESQGEQVYGLRAELENLRRLAKAAYRSYPTLHSHMIHCDVHRKDGVCTCGKRESDVALVEALRAWKGEKP